MKHLGIDHEIENALLKMAIFHIARSASGTPEQKIDATLVELIEATELSGLFGDKQRINDITRVALHLKQAISNKFSGALHVK